MSTRTPSGQTSWLSEARRRGVLRVAASYAVIAWLLLQIADVTFGPLGVPTWVLTTLIISAAIGFPVALALAWFFDLSPQGLQRESATGVTAAPMRGVRRYADVIIIAVLVAVVAALVVRQRDMEQRFGALEPAVAVMPFTNLGGDPAQEYFSDGLADELIGRLGQVPGLKVAARSSSFALKRKQLDAKSIARELGVAAILEGSVRRSGGQLRLSAALIDGRSGFQLWSASYERTVERVFDIQEEITRAVTDTLISPDEQRTMPDAKAPTSDVTAHDLYLLGIAGRAMIGDEALSRSVEYLEKAVARDPEYAQAWAALSRAIIRRDFKTLIVSPSDPAAVRAEQAAYKALALDSTLAEAHGALGYVLGRTARPGAEEAFDRALAINPNSTTVLHDYMLSVKNKPEDEPLTMKLQERILELDPLAVNNRLNYLNSLLQRGRTEEFGAVLRRGLELHDDDPAASMAMSNAVFGTGFPELTYRLARMRLAAGDELTGRTLLANAWAGVDPARIELPIDPHPAPRVESFIARGHESGAYMLTGDLAAAERIMRDLAEQITDEDGPERGVAFLLTLQGRFAEAADLFDELPDELRDMGPPGVTLKQGLTAKLYVYRQLGRADRARAVLDYYKEHVLPMRRTEPGNNASFTEIAGVEAVEGRRTEAIAALRNAMKVSELPPNFIPQLPWFASLEGTPGYAELLRERERRIAKAKAEFAKIDAEFAARER